MTIGGKLTYILGKSGKSYLAHLISAKNELTKLRTRIFHEGACADDLDSALPHFDEVIVCWPGDIPSAMPVAHDVFIVGVITIMSKQNNSCPKVWKSFLKEVFPHLHHTEVRVLMHRAAGLCKISLNHQSTLNEPSLDAG